MTQQDPEKRTSVRNYRHILEGRRDPSTLIARSTIAESSNTNMDENSKDVFPDYFSRVVHPIFQMLHVKGVSPDDRIVILCEVGTLFSYSTLLIKLVTNLFVNTVCLYLMMNCDMADMACRIMTR